MWQPFRVIPAKAGISGRKSAALHDETPASAGVTSCFAGVTLWPAAVTIYGVMYA